jgi:hypothetical protein
MRIRSTVHLAIMALLGGILLMTAACSNDDDSSAKVAREQDEPFTGSPTALAERDENTEEIELEIHDGKFGEDEIELQEEQASVITVTNHDNTEYKLEIEDLVAGSPIAAGTTTMVELTTSASGTFTATLRPVGGSESLDTMTVQVTSPGNVPD